MGGRTWGCMRVGQVVAWGTQPYRASGHLWGFNTANTPNVWKQLGGKVLSLFPCKIGKNKVRNMNRQAVTPSMCKPSYTPVPRFPSTNIGNNFYQVSQMLESSAGLVKMLKNPQLSPDLESSGKSFAVHRVLIIYFSVLWRHLLHTPPPGEAEKSGT